MVGFWEDGVRLHEGGESSGLGPNMPLPANSVAWMKSMKPDASGRTAAGVAAAAVKDSSEEAEFIESIWKNVEVGEEDVCALEEYHDADIGFTGRFFLRSKSADEIDEEVLSGAGGGACGGGKEAEEDEPSKQDNKKRKFDR